jgi:hypothetical protein
MLMHDREYNDRSSTYVPAAQTEIGAFRRSRPGVKAKDSYLASMIGEWMVLTLLILATAGAIFTIQTPLGRTNYARFIQTQTESFANAVSATWTRDRDWLQQRQWRAAFEQERQMSFSQLMNRWQPLVQQASKKFGMPAAWIRVVIQMESGGRTMIAEDKQITSKVGAVGLMQLMPDTYKDMRKQYKLGANPFNPHDNIMAGAAYLKWLHGKYGFPAMFVAYNDGPGNLEAKQSKGRALPAETRNYVSKICATLGVATPAVGGASHKDLVKLTRPNGKAVWIERTAVASVRRPLRGEYARSVKAVITVGRTKQAVRESLASAKAALRVHARYG